MICGGCGNSYSKSRWRCPGCRRFNLFRLGLLAGLILSPLALLAIGIYWNDFADHLGFSRRVFHRESILFLFPIAGVPFIWFADQRWLWKIGFSMAYWVFCYGFVVLAVVLIVLLHGFCF